jgi:hypothetical protein
MPQRLSSREGQDESCSGVGFHQAEENRPLTVGHLMFVLICVWERANEGNARFCSSNPSGEKLESTSKMCRLISMPEHHRWLDILVFIFR